MSRDAAVAALPDGLALVDGKLVDGTGESFAWVHPGDGREYAARSLAGTGEVDSAVAAAKSAGPAWRSASGSVRREALLGVASALRASADELGGLVSLEMGMPVAASRGGVLHAAEWFSYYAGWADKIDGLVAPVPGAHDYTTPVPYGVVGAIIPWNGPVIAAALKLAPALAAGNTVVLKPSELAPFSTIRMAEVAGLPSGVLNVVGGAGDAGAALCGHPDVALISFTGGDTAGRAVASAAAQRHVPTVLELGGKSASILFEDADVARAGKLAALLGVVQNSGQGCFLPTRVLVARPVYEQVLERITATLSAVAQGDPFEKGVSMGPVVNEAAAVRILGVVDAARSGSARLVAGGARLDRPGSFVAPTVFADVDNADPLAQEEIFGPVLSVLPFDDEDEAVALANDTRFGLAGYVWTRDVSRAHRVADRIDAGYVSVNSMAGLPPSAPFGGWKASGHGTEGGAAGLREFLRTKNIHVAL